MNDFFEVFVPGRVCLLGEHSDWAGGFRRFNSELDRGYCVVYGTDTGIFARVRRHPNKLILRCIDQDGKVVEATYPMDVAALRTEAARGGFFSYCVGVASIVIVNHDVGGLEIENYKTTLPVRKGLSSSAAVCVLVARAFNRAYDLRLTTRGEMELGYQGEIVTPSRCGRMDQCCAFGKTCVMMTFDGDYVETSVVDPPAPLYFVVADLQRGKNTKVILGSLTRSYPFGESEIDKGVQKFLGEINTRIVHEALAAVASGDAPGLGRLLNEAQLNFDRYLGAACPEELTAPRLHQVMSHASLQPLIYGTKGVGSQGDGCVQFLCKDPAGQEAVAKILEAELGCTSFKFTLGEKTRLLHCVIPVAGDQPLMFPASVVCGTSLLPVVDARDSIAKPLILLLVEEAVAAGMERVILVVRAEDEALFQRLFSSHPVPASPALAKYAVRLKELAARVVIVVQASPHGLGNAILCARESVGAGNPFAVLLGDHIYKSSGVTSCLQQLMDKRASLSRAAIGLRLAPPSEVSTLGAVSGAWSSPSREIMSVSVVMEKPTEQTAAQSLVTDESGHFYTAFGNYILGAEFFGILAQDPNHSFASALDSLRKVSGLDGVVINGSRTDFHSPELYSQVK